MSAAQTVVLLPLKALVLSFIAEWHSRKCEVKIQQQSKRSSSFTQVGVQIEAIAAESIPRRATLHFDGHFNWKLFSPLGFFRVCAFFYLFLIFAAMLQHTHILYRPWCDDYSRLGVCVYEYALLCCVCKTVKLDQISTIAHAHTHKFKWFGVLHTQTHIAILSNAKLSEKNAHNQSFCNAEITAVNWKKKENCAHFLPLSHSLSKTKWNDQSRVDTITITTAWVVVCIEGRQQLLYCATRQLSFSAAKCCTFVRTVCVWRGAIWRRFPPFGAIYNAASLA